MKYILLTVAIINNWSSCSSQTVLEPKTCQCKLSSFTLSNPHDSAKITLEPNGIEVLSLNFPYGNENEECVFFFDVIACDNGWVKIKEKNSNGNFWIEPKKLGISGKEFGFNLYAYPESKKSIHFSNRGKILTLLGCEGNWALVQYQNDEGSIIKGWLSPKDQCANPFTTCN